MARASHCPHLYAPLYFLTSFDLNPGKMSITRHQSVTMGNFHGFAITGFPSSMGNSAARGRQYRLPAAPFEINAAMHRAAAVERISAIAETARHHGHIG